MLQFVAAPLGGLLVTLGEVRLAFLLNALSFLISAVFLGGLPRMQALGRKPRSWRPRIPEILSHAHDAAVIRPLLAVQGLAALAAGATSALLVVLARTAYGLNGTGYGLWLAVIAGGAIAGPLLAPLLDRFSATRVLSGAYAVRGLGDLLLSLLTNGAGGALVLGVYGVNTSSGMVAFQTLVQREVPPDLRGRAFAALDLTWQIGRLLSIALGGLIVGMIGIRILFGAGGALLFVAGAIGWLFLPHSGLSYMQRTSMQGKRKQP
jgi:MFS family permease